MHRHLRSFRTARAATAIVAATAPILLLAGTAPGQTGPLDAPRPPGPPAKLAAGTRGLWNPGLLLQGWFTTSVAEAADGDLDTTDQFRIRRAELHFKGEILPGRVAWAVMIDPAKVLEPSTVEVAGTDVVVADTRLAVFQDLVLTYLTPWADVSLGQFKIPVSWEGHNSSSKLLFPERASVSREFGDRRDLGIRVAKTFARFGYSAGLWNGTELNRPDDDAAKDAGLRLEAYPVPGLTIAGVAYLSLWDRDTFTKDRFEGDLRYERGPVLLQGEYIYARNRRGGATETTDAHGFYAAAALTLPARLQPAVRVGLLDRDLDADDDHLLHGEVGLNYYLQRHEAKLQASYGLFRQAGVEDRDEHLLILSGQVAF